MGPVRIETPGWARRGLRRDEALDIVAPSPSARLADEGERRGADVGQSQRVAISASLLLT
jgi:hypothetical protein